MQIKPKILSMIKVLWSKNSEQPNRCDADILTRSFLMMYKGRRLRHYIIFGNKITQFLLRLHCTLTFSFLFFWELLFAIWLNLQSSYGETIAEQMNSKCTYINNVCVKTPNRFVTMNIKITNFFFYIPSRSIFKICIPFHSYNVILFGAAVGRYAILPNDILMEFSP